MSAAVLIYGGALSVLARSRATWRNTPARDLHMVDLGIPGWEAMREWKIQDPIARTNGISGYNRSWSIPIPDLTEGAGGTGACGLGGVAGVERRATTITPTGVVRRAGASEPQPEHRLRLIRRWPASTGARQGVAGRSLRMRGWGRDGWQGNESAVGDLVAARRLTLLLGAGAGLYTSCGRTFRSCARVYRGHRTDSTVRSHARRQALRAPRQRRSATA